MNVAKWRVASSLVISTGCIGTNDIATCKQMMCRVCRLYTHPLNERSNEVGRVVVRTNNGDYWDI